MQGNLGYGRHINNQLYTQDNQTISTPKSSLKLTEMSSDLNKLKQQLSKIMTQADKFDKKNLQQQSNNITTNFNK